MPQCERLLRISEVQEVTSLSRSTVLRRVAAGEFPRPVKLGPRAVAWRLSAVAEWIESLPENETAGLQPAASEPFDPSPSGGNQRWAQ